LKRKSVRHHSILAEAHRLAMESSKKNSEDYKHHYEQMSRHNDEVHRELKRSGYQHPIKRFEVVDQARQKYAHGRMAPKQLSHADDKGNRQFVARFK